MNWLKAIDPVVDEAKSAPWEDAEFYKEFLAQVYYFVRHSTRMLAAAASLTSSEKYYDRLIAHIGEENKHELLALADLKKMGDTIDDHPEAGITRALWEPQFVKIQRSPTSLLGYVLALEIVAVRLYPGLRPGLEKAHGKNSMSFIRVHSDDDPDHVAKAVEQVKHLSEFEQRAVIENYTQTCEVLNCLMDAIKRSAARRSDETRRLTPVEKRSA